MGNRVAASMALALASPLGCGAITPLEDDPIRDAGPEPVDSGCPIPDVDGDGHASPECGGDDCDDSDRTIRPGAYDPIEVDDGPWEIEVVDEGIAGGEVSLAVDDAGTVHVAYLANRALRYARGEDGGWSHEVVDDDGLTGFHPSIALDTDGNVHMSYAAEGDGLRYATNLYGAWEIEVLGGSPAYRTSIAVDPLGTVHVGSFWSGTRELVHSTRSEGAGWTHETIERQMGTPQFLSLAVDRGGQVHLSFHELNLGLSYATNPSGAWDVERVDPSEGHGEFSAIAVDARGDVHIGYSAPAALAYATNAHGRWQAQTVSAVGNTGLGTSIALDGSGGVHLCYFADGDLGYAENRTGAWITEIVDRRGRTSDVSTSLAVGAGRTHVASYDEENQVLRYASRTSTDWIDQDCDGHDG